MEWRKAMQEMNREKQWLPGYSHIPFTSQINQPEKQRKAPAVIKIKSFILILKVIPGF